MSAAMDRSASSSDCRIVPLPDASTPIRLTVGKVPEGRRTLRDPRSPCNCPNAVVSFPRGARCGTFLCDGGQTVEKNPTPGEIVVMAGAGVVLIFSFLNFYKNPFGGG